MANDDFAEGLRPVNWKSDTLPVHVYEADSAAARGVIFMGQPVALDASGLVGNAVQVGGTGTAYLGVAVGFLSANAGGPQSDTLPYLDTGGTAKRFVIVADDPDQEFLIQADTGGTLATLAARGESADLIYRSAGSGNTTTGRASLELDASSNVATNSGAVIILRLHDVTNSDGTQNAAGANYTKWIVRIDNHQKRGQPVVNTAI